MPTHTRDSDCALDPRTDTCRDCGVYHGDPCPECGGRGFHALDCPTFAFYVDTDGYVNGRPYVLPHAPGERAYGLVGPGWYVRVCARCASDDGLIGPENNRTWLLAARREAMAYCSCPAYESH